MSRADRFQVAFFVSGFALIWAGGRLGVASLVPLGFAALGAGFAAAGYDLLAAALAPPVDPQWAMTSSQKTVIFIRGLIQTGFGLALALGAVTVAVLGSDALWRMLEGQPGPVFLGVGAALIGMSIEVVLGEGQRMRSRWEFVASLPLRLASLPLLALGLACLAVGGYSLPLPGPFQATIHSMFGSLLTGP